MYYIISNNLCSLWSVTLTAQAADLLFGRQGMLKIEKHKVDFNPNQSAFPLMVRFHNRPKLCPLRLVLAFVVP